MPVESSSSPVFVYRPEIDGLRALAVLPVILFHTHLGILEGGFVGVDIFFVISGYLITSLLLAEAGRSKISMLRFYERRARRILPALFFVILCCIPLAWLWLIPSQWEDFTRSIIASALFLSNVYFWTRGDYFAPDATELPLLHTWSLAVEEQYYIFFPLLLLVLLPFGLRRTGYVILALAALSLALSVYASAAWPSAAYFLAPTRAWEILAGALCAFLQHERGQRSNGLLGLLGLVLIAVSFFAFDETTPFPSFYALLPIAGTVLFILYAASGTAPATLMSTRVLVWLGLVSYSAYLWHQPLMAFARIRSYYDPSPLLLLAMVPLSIALAFLTWYFIEMPARRMNLSGLKFPRLKLPGLKLPAKTLVLPEGAVPRLSSARVVGLAATACLAVALLGFGLHAWGERLGGPERRLLAERISSQVRGSIGLARACQSQFVDDPACRTSDAPEIAVWGDSFAMHLIEGILASNPDARLIQMTMSRCGPFLGLAPYAEGLGIGWSRKCIANNRQVLDWLAAAPSVRYVVLSSPLRAYVSEDWQVLADDGAEPRPSSPELSAEHLAATVAAIRALGKIPIFFSPTPQSGLNIGRCLAASRWLHHDPARCDFRYADRAPVTLAAERFLHAAEPLLPVIWLDPAICPDRTVCRTSEGDTLLYLDDGHLTHDGSILLGTKMDFYDLIVAAGASQYSARNQGGCGPTVDGEARAATVTGRC